MVFFTNFLKAQVPEGYTWQDTSNVDFGEGANHFIIKAATSGLGGEVALRLDAADGPLIGHAFFHQTGSTNYFMDYECDLYQTVNGTHDVYMNFLDYVDPIAEEVLKVGDFQFSMVEDLPVTPEGNLHVYPPVPGLDPSPYYEIRIQKVSELNSGNLAEVTNWETPFAWFTQCRTDEKGYYYQFGVGGWSQTYTNFELDSNTPIVVKITRKSSGEITDGAPSGPIEKAAVTPEHNIDSWEIIDGDVYVTMSNPAQVVIDVDRRMSDRKAPRVSSSGWNFPYSSAALGSHVVTIFANPFIEDKPNPDDPNVYVVKAGEKIPDNLDKVSEDIIYFEPGIHKTSVDVNDQGELVERYWEQKDIIRLGNNKSYYIPGNAIVYGNLRSDDGRNIRVFGHGALSGLKIMHFSAFNELGINADGWNHRGIVIEKAKNCHVEGITMENPANHTFGFHDIATKGYQPSSVTWVKVIGWRTNTDGLSASGNLFAEDCFFRVQDDGLYIGGAKPMLRCIYWHDVNGQTFRGDFMTSRIASDYDASLPQQLVAEDIDIIFARAVFTTGDNGSGIIGVSGGSGNQTLPGGTENTGQMILFRNIRISDPMPTRNLFSFNVEGKKNDYAGLRFENIQYSGKQIFGWRDHLEGSPDAAIRNFVFDNVTIDGKKMDANYFNDPKLFKATYVSDFTFRLRDTIPSTDYVLIRTATNGTIDFDASGPLIEVTAIPSPGYGFAGWSGDLSGTDSIATITMDEHKTITANFKLITYTISATSENGTIIPDPDQPWYESGAEVSITAAGDLGYVFDSWGGDLSGMENPTTITMDGDKSISASFKSVPIYKITTTVDHGTILLDPPGGEYSEGTEVKVTYLKDFGYQLDEWSGELTGSENPQTIIVDADKDITAISKFTGDAITSYAINCGGGAYEASDGTLFTKDMNFSGGNTYSTGSTITGTDDPSLYKTERYGDLVYSFDLTNGEYIVTLMFAEIYASAPGARLFNVLIDGEIVIDSLDLVAEVGKNAAYSESFSVHVNDGSLDIELQTLRDNAKISAIQIMPEFEGATYTLTTETTHGTIVTKPAGNVFMENTIVTLEAIPDNGYAFFGWDDDLLGSDNPASIIMDADKNITAKFDIQTGVDELLSNNSGQNGLGQNYPNPFSTKTTIPYQLKEATDVLLTVYDLFGRKVAVLVNEHQEAGYYSIDWFIKDGEEKQLSNGLYMYQLMTNNNTVQIKKASLIK